MPAHPSSSPGTDTRCSRSFSYKEKTTRVSPWVGLIFLTICALVCNLAHVTCSLPEVWPYRCKQNNTSHEKLNDALKKFKGAVLILGK